MSRISRAAFLRGDLHGRRTPIRPPWAIDEETFIDRCTRCDDCAQACPEKIITRGPAGFPAIDFRRGECTFCGDCAAACKPQALHMPRDATPDTAWSIKAVIQPGCLALRRIECRVCGEQCEARAIRFRLAAGAVATPSIDSDLCSGCGACVAPCPVEAISVRIPRNENTAVLEAAS